MNKIKLSVLTGAIVCLFANTAFAQSSDTAPAQTGLNKSLPQKVKKDRVDELLERLMENQEKSPEIDSAYEQKAQREVNVFKSSQQVIKPVAFVQIGKLKYILISMDGKSVTRVRENKKLGSIVINEIDEDGVTYTLGSKQLYTPYEFETVDPPKAPQNQQGNGTGGNGQQPTAQSVLQQVQGALR